MITPIIIDYDIRMVNDPASPIPPPTTTRDAPPTVRDDDTPGARQGVEAIETGGRLLAALARAERPMMLRDLATAAAMPAAKAHRYLVSLSRLGLVVQHGEGGRYDIGPFAIELGLAGLSRLDPLQAAFDELEGLRDRLGHTVAVAVWGNRGPTIVRWLDSNAPVSAGLRTGSVMPLTRSATGRAFLGFMRPETVRDALAAELAANRRAGLEPADAAAAAALADQVRAHGLGRVTGDLVPGVHSLAAPVRDADGAMAMALLALGVGDSFDAGWDGPVAQALRHTAARVTRRLGGRPAQ